MLTDDLDARDSLQDLLRRVSVTRFNELYPQRFGDFSAFLNRNNLITAYQDGGRALAEFDRSIRAAATVPDVISRGPRNPVRRAAIRARSAVRPRARRLRA
ncbi:MAG TPA: hypothetical protein VFP34_00270 [Microlunatus sp.]|nr:hypothetical protein [Microlunatus sp.]